MVSICRVFEKHDIQCFIVALFTIVTSVILIGLAIIYLLPEKSHHEIRAALANLPIAENCAPFLSTMTLLVCSIWMVSGFVLIIGVQRNYSGCVLFFFVYGIFFTIMLHVATLLLLLHKDWAYGMGILFISLLHISGLVAVYQTYDVMLRNNARACDEELLVEDTDTLPLPDENV